MATPHLTAKQEKFCQAIIDGCNQSDAYRHAYDAGNMKAETIWSKASVLMDDGKVEARLHELKSVVVAKVVEKRAWDLDRLVSEAEINMAGAREDRQWSAANGSLATIGKATGLLTDKVDVNVTHTLKPGLTLEELEARVTRLDALEAGVIDVEGVVLDDTGEQGVFTDTSDT